MAEKTTIARPYAEAVFEVANEQGKLKEWSEKSRAITGYDILELMRRVV